MCWKIGPSQYLSSYCTDILNQKKTENGWPLVQTYCSISYKSPLVKKMCFKHVQHVLVTKNISLYVNSSNILQEKIELYNKEMGNMKFEWKLPL